MRVFCDSVSPLHLRDPPLAAADRLAAGPGGPGSPPFAWPPRFWLVAHSGPSEEVAELLTYARDLQRIEGDQAPIVVATPVPARTLGSHGDARCVDVYPASVFFSRAARVVSACGYNVMRQMAAHADRHRVLPLPRRYDDQFTRAARWRAAQGDVCRIDVCRIKDGAMSSKT